LTEFFVEPLFDLPLTVTSGQVFRWKRVGREWRGADGAIEYRYDPGSRMLWTTTDEISARSYLGFIDDPLDRAERIRRLDPRIGDLACAGSGLGLMQPTSLTETIVSFLCSSNNHISRITRMVERLCDAFGSGSMPSMEAIGQLGTKQLRDLGFGYRAEFVVEAAQRLLTLGNWEASLRTHDRHGAREALMRLKGIGRKVADCIALYGLGHYDAVPVDVHLWRAYCHFYEPTWRGRSLTAKRYDAIGDNLRDRFGMDAGYVQLLLYRTVLT
jgi:N-glycosylase/DNA lyase